MHTPIWLPRLALAALCTLTACGGADPAGPSGPDDPDDPDGPGPTTESRWDITLTPRYVRGSSSKTCDGDGLFGAEDPGEYQFRINGQFGSTSRSYETNNYGSVTGANMQLEANEVGNFTNQNWTFADLKTGQAVALRMWVTEWDLTSKDSYMKPEHPGQRDSVLASSCRRHGAGPRALGRRVHLWPHPVL